MRTHWASFPYRPRFGDPAIDALESLTVTAPEQLCQSDRHMMSTTPAAYLEVLFTPAAESMTVHRAWFTCSGCHAQVEAAHAAEVTP